MQASENRGVSNRAAEADALRAGVIGLGPVGSGLAVSLSRSGRTPLVFDARPNAFDGLASLVIRESSAFNVGRKCDVVLITVFDEEQVRQVLMGPRGVLAGAQPGLVVVVVSTVTVAAVEEFARLCTESDVALLDCGITPGDQASTNGVVGLVGGPAEVVARALPILNDFARVVVHCGPVGAGMAVKIARNLVTYCTWAAVHEASLLAEASGIEQDTFLRAMRETEAEHPQSLKLLELRTSGFAAPTERVRNATQVAAKDLDAAVQLSRARGVPISLPEATKPLMGPVFGTT